MVGLTGNDTLYGLGGNDNLFGATGADSIDGGAGADTLYGGKDNDSYVVDSTSDYIIEFTGEGIDTVFSAVTCTLAANVENLTLTGSASRGDGNALDNSLTGNGGGNLLYGYDGNDYIDGGAGADTMAGGAGSDTYVVDNAGDVVTELSGGEGVDLILASVSYDLAVNIEDVILTGAGHISATGNSMANHLTGNSGNNYLDGRQGADTLTGGLGNDTYYVDSLSDLIVETAGQGTDTIAASISYTLKASVSVENLTLTGRANINATGRANNNVLTGNDGNNILDGAGGADTMAGGRGNDTYYVDNAGDVIVENAVYTYGNDTVNASVSYVLAAGVSVETLNLSGTALNATGNGYNNHINGNALDNVLDGGAGYDILTGGAGNDTYIVRDGSEFIVELAGEGTDLVRSSTSFTLRSNVENLILTGVLNASGTGNASANSLTGNAGNNKLDGLGGDDTLSGLGGNDSLDGGAGADTMAGGLGNDTYYVDNAGDVIVEAAGEGTDIILASISFVLAEGLPIEYVTLAGGNDINATGNSADNYIKGNNGANLLDGGAGNDTLVSVSIYGHNKYDTLNGGAGDDVLYASESHTRMNGGDGADTMYGSLGYDTITGGDGNDLLSAGTGYDSLSGGAGDDTYVIDDNYVAAVIVEIAGEGVDTVQSSITYTLAANFENLTLTGTRGINGTGNNANNIIVGNSGANILQGFAGDDLVQGGAGNDILGGFDGKDTLQGGDGNDTLIGHNGDDILSGGAGADKFDYFSYHFDNDVIADFSAAQNDIIYLQLFSSGVPYGGGITLTTVGADTLIDIGSNGTILVLGVVSTDPGLLSHIVW